MIREQKRKKLFVIAGGYMQGNCLDAMGQIWPIFDKRPSGVGLLITKGEREGKANHRKLGIPFWTPWQEAFGVRSRKRTLGP